MFDNIAGLFNMASTQPDTPSDAFGMDWSLDTIVTVPFDQTSSVSQDPTTPNEPNFMFPGLYSEGLYPGNTYPGNSLWMTEPTQSQSLARPLDETPYYMAPSPLSSSGTGSYPPSTPSTGLGLILTDTTPAPSIPPSTPAYSSPAPSYNMTTYSSPVASYGPSTPASSAHSLTQSYASPYSSPSHAALVYKSSNKPGQFHPPAPSSLGPNRVTRIKTSAPSKPYLRLPPALTKARPRSSVCPLTDPEYDWSALKTPNSWLSNQMTDQMMGNSAMIGWAGEASADLAIHSSSGHMAHTAIPPIVAPTFSPTPSWNGFQTATPSAAGGSSAAGSPAPSLSFLQVESSPTTHSPSPSSCGLNMDLPSSSVEDSSTILATTPTGPLFPALASGAASTPSTLLTAFTPVPPVPVPAPASMPGTSTSFSMSTPAPMPAPARTFTPILMPAYVPTPKPSSRPTGQPNSMLTSMLHVVQTPAPAPINMPTPEPISMPPHLSATTPKIIPIPKSIPVPTTPVHAPIPKSLSAFVATGSISSTPASSPSPSPVSTFMPAPALPSVDTATVSVPDMTPATAHNPAPTATRAPTRISPQAPAHAPAHTPTCPAARAPTARIHAPALAHNPPYTGTHGSAIASGSVASSAPMHMPLPAGRNTGPIPAAPTPTFTWPGSNMDTIVPTAAAAAAVRDWGTDDDLDREIALVAGFELGDTGFQSAERLPELTNSASDWSELSAPTQAAKLRRGKKTASLGKKWTGGLGGELTIHGLPDGVDDLLHRWTFSEDGPDSTDATGRTEGDVHFSTTHQRLPSDRPFKSWVAVRVGEDRLQWAEWQGGHPHPWLTGYVFKPAQLARTQPRWIKKQTWLKSVAKGEETDTMAEEGSSG